MAGLIESIVDDIARAVGQRVTERVSGGGSSIGGGNTVANVPPLNAPSGGGATGGGYPTQFTAAAPTYNARGVISNVGAVATAIASLPDTRQIVNMQLATSQAAAMGVGGGTTAGVIALQRQLAARGTMTSPTDAPIALQQAGLLGMGGSNTGAYLNSLSTISNLMPGLGGSAAASAYMSMQNPTNVNMLRMFGINMRNLQTGKANDINSVVNEIWGFLNRTKNTTGPITSEDINISLMPGNFLDRFLSQFGGDANMQQALVQALYAKAGGAKTFNKQELRRLGFTTEAITKESEAIAAKQDKMTVTTDAMVTGFEAATTVVKFFTEQLTKAVEAVEGPLGFLLQGYYTAKGFVSGVLKRADGGPTQTNKPYIIGERGPEVFVPETDGYIIPNHHLPDGMRANLRRMTYSYNADDSSLVTGKGRIPRAKGSDIRRWATSFLAEIGAPITDDNLKAIGMWAQREGGWSQNSAAYNPLNTTLPLPGSWSMNDVGVKGYRTFEEGIRATVATLEGNRADQRGYTAILNALRGNAGVVSVLSAVNASAWRAGESAASNYNFKGIRPLWEVGGKSSGYIDIPMFSGSGSSSSNQSPFSSQSPFLKGSFGIGSGSMFMGGVADYISSLRAKGNFGDLLANQQATLARKASGGRVSGGTPYMVGEMGAEQFVPDGSNPSMGQVINYGGVTVKFEIPEGMTDERLFKKFKELLELDGINRKARGR